ncbi:MAG: hypothetical protein ACOH18_00075 [Candidatus Saccharimonadaceae bacterium]
MISEKSNQCVIICGPSGVGKTMSVDFLIEKHGYYYVPFITTRALRPEEFNTGSESLSYRAFMDLNLEGKVFLAARNYGNAYGHSIDNVYDKLISGQKIILESPSSQLLTDVHVLLPNALVLGFVTEDHSMTTEVLNNRHKKMEIDAELRILQSSIEVFNIKLAEKSMPIIRIHPKFGDPLDTINQVNKAIGGGEIL